MRVHGQIFPGTLDSNFRYRSSSSAFNPRALALASDGRVLAFPDGASAPVLITAAGNLETQIFGLGHVNSGSYRILRQSTGRFVGRVVFSSPVTGRTLSGFAGFDITGAIDPAFIFPSIPSGGTRNYNGAVDIALGADDRIHIVGRNLPFGGNSTHIWVTLDRDGNELFGLTGTDQIQHAAEQPDGKVLLSGVFATGSGNTFLVRRLANGDPDPTFSASLPGSVNVLRLIQDGRPLVSGGNAARGLPYVWILNSDGSKDVSFDSTSAVEGSSRNIGSVADVLVQPDGRVVAGGSFQGAAVIRMRADGSFDDEFSSDLTDTSPVSTMLMKDNLLYVGVPRIVTRMFLGEATVSGPPEITIPPAGGRFAAGSQVFLSVTATGTPPLAYQWRRNGADIPSETSDRYLFQLTQLNAGDFDVVVRNSSGSITSAVARVTLDVPAPTVSLVPSFPVVLGSRTSFGPTVSGEIPPTTYQWYKGVEPVVGATNLSFPFPSVVESDAGTYRFVLNDSFGNSVTSGPCVVTVTLPPPPLVTREPLGVIVPAGTPVTLIADFRSESFTLPLAVQWRRNGRNISGGVVASHENTSYTATLILGDLPPGEVAFYDCVATNPGGVSLPTRQARVVVKSPAAPDVVDQSFNAGTANRIAFNNPDADGAIEGIAIQPDDRIIVVGTFKQWNGQPRTNIVRLNVDGSLDTTFAAHHFTATVNGEMTVPGVAIAPGGKVYVTGQWGTVDGSTAQLIRLNADGTLDGSFVVGDAAPGFLLLTRPDGTLLNNGVGIVGGAVRYLLRYPAGGSLDLGFGAPFSASRFSGSGPSDWFANPDGTYVLGGAFGANDGAGFAQFNLTKLNADGSVAAGFRSPLDQPDIVNHVARLPDGRFIATGDFHNPVRNVRRFRADGASDPAFDSPLTGAAFSPVAVDTDGTVVLPANTGNELFRLQAEGAPDDTFFVHVDDDIRLTAIDSRGRIVIAGYFTRVTGSFNDSAHTVARKSIARLLGRNGSAGPAPEVRLGAVNFTPGGPLTFTLATQVGVTYLLETKSTLGDPNWTLSQTITGDGSIKTLQTAIAGVQGYYRVRVQQ